MSDRGPELEITHVVLTDSDGNEVMPSTEPKTYTRRAVIIGGTVTGITCAVGGAVAARTNSMDRAVNWLKRRFVGDEEPVASQYDCDNGFTPEEIDEFDMTSEIVIEPTGNELLDKVESGIKRDWEEIMVHPGILTLDPGVKVRTSPFADGEELTLDQPLYVQRPFLVRPTIFDINQERLTAEEIVTLTEAEIPVGMVGFFAPDSNEIMYLDYNQEFVGIDRYSRAQGGDAREGVDSEAIGLSQDRVNVRGRQLINGNIYPYLYKMIDGSRWSEEDAGYICDPDTIDFLVLMRSAYVDDPRLAVIGFSSGKPPVDIPSQKKSP